MQTRYEREAYQFLAVFRFLSYALAVMFTQVVSSLSAPAMSPPATLYNPDYTRCLHRLEGILSSPLAREKSDNLSNSGRRFFALYSAGYLHQRTEQRLPALFTDPYYDRRPSL